MTVSILFGGIFIYCETLSCSSPYSTIDEERCKTIYCFMPGFIFQDIHAFDKLNP